MRPIPNTEKLIEILICSIDLIDMITDENNPSLKYSKPSELKESLRDSDNEIANFDLQLIDKDFWEVCDSLDKIGEFKNAFAVRFRFLFEWRLNENYINKGIVEADVFDNARLIDRLQSFSPKIDLYDINQIVGSCYFLNLALQTIKRKITEMFQRWQDMAPDSAPDLTLKSDMNQVEYTAPIDMTIGAKTEPSKFRLALKRKTDFIKIISAMYDCRMFETENGYIASNKQELMNEFGKFFNEDFSKYSASLSQSKNANKETYLKPFKEILKKSEEYFEK